MHYDLPPVVFVQGVPHSTQICPSMPHKNMMMLYPTYLGFPASCVMCYVYPI